jgi:motility quorum-sensing regulator/GCU-specific mRNA interferase toxin
LVRKLKPHHDLLAIQAKFRDVEALEITRTAENTARKLGYGLQDIVDAVQDLRVGDFVSSSPAHSPPIPGVWHDTYTMWWGDHHLYIKFAGTTIIDIVLVSFKDKTP